MQDRLSRGLRVAADLSRVGAGATRGTTRKRVLPSASWSSGTWPAPDSTLDLDFVNNRGWVRGVGQGGVMDAITFTRATSGTFVGSDGVLQGSGGPGNNLLSLPDNFENAFWTRSSLLTVSANTDISPRNTQTADSLIFSAINQQLVRDSFGTGLYGNIGQTFTFSVFLKVETGTATVAIVTGQGGAGGTRTTNTVNVTTDWQRFSVTHTMAINNYLDIFVQNINYVGTLIVWGAMMELGSVATEYTSANVNTPRFDWGSNTSVAMSNLLAQTGSIQTSPWVGFFVSGASSAELAPDGVSFAAAITGPGDTSTSWTQPYVLAPINTYTFSVWLKAASTFNTELLLAGQSTIINVTTSWTRFSFTTTTSSVATLSAGFRPSRDVGVTRTVFAWGAQLEIGIFVTNYKPVAQPTTITTLAANPTCNGLLVEEARTNRILQCRDATNAVWVKTNITTARDQTGIDGVENAASLLTATATDGTCIQTITLASGSRTCSVYLKRITGTGDALVSLDGTSWSTVELSTTEWRRIVLSATVTNPVVGIRLATNGDAVAMDYAQVEDGGFVTSPIFTLAASVTRASDNTSIIGSTFQSFYNANGGTIFGLKGSLQPLGSSGGYAPYIQFRMTTSAAGANQIFIGQNVSGTNLIVLAFNTTTQVSNGFANSNTMAVAISSTRLEIATKVGSAVASNGPLSPVIDQCRIGWQTGGSTSYLNNTISRIIYIPKVISLSALQEMNRIA